MSAAYLPISILSATSSLVEILYISFTLSIACCFCCGRVFPLIKKWLRHTLLRTVSYFTFALRKVTSVLPNNSARTLKVVMLLWYCISSTTTKSGSHVPKIYSSSSMRFFSIRVIVSPSKWYKW